MRPVIYGSTDLLTLARDEMNSFSIDIQLQHFMVVDNINIIIDKTQVSLFVACRDQGKACFLLVGRSALHAFCAYEDEQSM